MNKSRGFTIIELIVVIAIIAVLAAIVLVNVTQYINKGKDAAAEGNLATMMTNGAVYNADSTLGNGTYSGWFTGTSPIAAYATCATGATLFTNPCQALYNAGYTSITVTCDVASCGAASSKWCAMVTLKASTNTYCVDSSGNKLNKATGACTGGVCS